MTNIKFYKAIVFCSNPMKGFYRFKDIFQIYPFTSENSPKSDKVKLFPIAIEYWVDNDAPIDVISVSSEVSDIIAKMTRAQNRQKEILNLLSSITNFRFSYPTPEINWFVEIPNGTITNDVEKLKSIGGMSLYWYPELHADNQISTFSVLTFPPIELVDHKDYFVNIDIDHKDTVKFPQYIDKTLEKYFLLNGESLQTINSTFALICNGIDLRNKMKSLSFVSFVSGIETMVNYEYRNSDKALCEKCNRPILSISAKFRDYLFKYASDGPKSKKKINKIYEIRSKIVHTGLLLLGDNLFDWSDDKKQGDEWQTHLEAMQINRLSITNWLLLN